ncbi:suppressor of fused domain protein [Psychroserpens damuponensis]|uniref:suppressor of fused domain protein n=1 Tax=Psychroserpens damuponensis TaxID=943936 RepID=UPI00058EE29B|nr:suppressor of fused domain protein [Psychroserpens damuponensis]
MNGQTSENPESIEWDAIDGILKKEYGEQVPQHYAPKVYYSLGGNEPLDGISIYVDKENKCYHYVTYGFSEIYEKETDQKDISGFGFELTFRLKYTKLLEKYPTWPINLLQNIAKATFSKGLTFKAYQTLSSGPIRLEPSTEIKGIIFTFDPTLKEMKTENGNVEFLQIFGLTSSEYQNIIDKKIDRREFISQVQTKNQLLITDAERK